MKQALSILLLLLLIGFVLAEDTNFYPTTIGELESEVKLTGHGTISGLKSGEEVKFQTLTFQESEFQKVVMKTQALYINGKTISPKYVLDEFNNKYVSFVIKENGEFNYELTADIITDSLIFELTDYNIGEAPANVELYTAPSEKVESGSTEITTLSKNKLLSNSFLSSLNKTVLWVNDYVEYAQGEEFQKYYLLQRSAIETLISKKGVCDEFANLSAAMLRAKGIPTRLAIGITFDGKEWGNHAWIEVYHKNFGWIPSDPTFREAGFVDATHIKMGAFSDVSLSLAKAYFPSTANVTFYTQTLPEVKINAKKYFGGIEITSENQELTANTWNEIKIKIKNITKSAMTAPISIKETYSELIIQDKKKSILINPGETKEILFKIFPKITLNENQQAKGSITFNSLAEPYSLDFIINPGNYAGSGEVIVKDITPIAHEGTLQIQVITTNYYAEEKQIDINILGGTTKTTTQVTLPGFSSKTTLTEIDEYKEDAYYVTVKTPTSIFSQVIVPEKQKIIISPKPLESETVVEQKIEHENKQSVADTISENPIIVVIALLLGVGVMLFGLIWVNKRYV